jgi:hypothetical protein
MKTRIPPPFIMLLGVLQSTTPAAVGREFQLQGENTCISLIAESFS